MAQKYTPTTKPKADMDFEKEVEVNFESYEKMISLKTSVLLAASLKMGAMLGGALERNQNLRYNFGKKLGLAFQVQDDYLDAFGDPGKFGKMVGGDIRANKKTFLLIHALQGKGKEELEELMAGNGEDKVERVLSFYREAGVDDWARELTQNYMKEAFEHLEDIAVLSRRKEPLKELASYLMNRES